MARFSPIAIILVLIGLGSCRDATGPTAPMGSVDSDVAALNDAWSTPRRVLFLHRSVGFALIRNGAVNMYDVLAELNAFYGTQVELWHHGLGTDPNWDGYFDGSDQQVVPNFGPAMSEPLHASPLHWKMIFCDPDSQYVAARDSIGAFRVIAFKSGYDNTVAYAAERAGQWRQYYRTMKTSALFNDPTRRIVVLGFPPLRQGLGGATQADADSSRAFNTWLVEEYVRDRDNLYGFPLFAALADSDNWLKDEYEMVDYPNDSHPNAYGCEIVGRDLMTCLHAAARYDGRPTWKAPQRHAEP